MLALARGRPAESFEQFRSARARLLAIDERLGAAGQLGYMARAAASVRLTDRAVVLGGMARQELRALGDRFGVMLAGQDLVGAALQAGNQQLAVYALLLTWHHAREIEDPRASKLAPHVATTNPPLPMELPLGSRLVVGAMRAFREKRKFVDALKPETPGVPLLLLYLDPLLAVKHLPGVATLGARALVGGLQRRLRHGPTLPIDETAPTPAPQSPRAAQPASDVDLLAGAIFDALSADERTERGTTPQVP